MFIFQGGRSLADAQHNRDYVVSKVSSEIHEIIRVLQLTTYDEDEWDADDITVMKKALVSFFYHFTINIFIWLLSSYYNFTSLVVFKYCVNSSLSSVKLLF